MRFLYLFILVSLFSCSPKPQIYEIAEEKDMIPEGIAIDPKSGKIYLSSVHKKKIGVFDPETSSFKDFITSGQYGFKRGVGMKVFDQMLFALGSDEESGKGASILLVLELESGNLIDSFSLEDSTSHFLNDLVIDGQGKIYLTDTEGHGIYALNYPEGEIELFFQDESIRYPNGIALSEDASKLFIDSWSDGIRILDLESKEILNDQHTPTSEFGIDGLSYHAGSLYAIHNSGEDHSKYGLYRIPLLENEKVLGDPEAVLIGHPKMNVPTTLSILEGTAYILANSQLDNLDQEKNQILSYEQLSPTFIIRLKLDTN
ncbi:MAG: SMP-30/gluconolactonase/LRE family protein [Bacteroidia bacterium]|nr:SMP-30/gluconolactonase/LRE family protein [Bacteroidia bacterium]